MISKPIREIPMTRFLALLAAFVCTVPAVASDKSDVLAVLHQWADSFAKSDLKAAAANCADEAVIFDEIPPFDWHGSGACSAWSDSFSAWAKQNNLTIDSAVISRARQVEISGDTAYVPALVTIGMKDKDGAVETEKGAWTVLLKKSNGAWRITGWSWATLSTMTPKKS
jgi:ketosteroid isomerase-like protein